MKKNLSVYSIKQALKNNADVKYAISELSDIFKEYNHVVLSFRYSAYVSGKINVVCENKTFEYPIQFCCTDTIIPEFCEFKEDYIYDLLANHISSKIYYDNLRFYKIKKVYVSEDFIFNIQKDNIILWSRLEVCRYHVEQECGEGWITIPRSPNTDELRGFLTGYGYNNN